METRKGKRALVVMACELAVIAMLQVVASAPIA
jgi:hypothetical protein